MLFRSKFWRNDTQQVAEQYRITVKESTGKTEVRVLDAKGVADGTEVGTRIVKLLHEQLR